ncbi:MAG TPA: DEAD/DEAH box helicase, partial [Kofleriaceae bacterium]
MPTDGELELAFYEKFLWGRGLEPYPVQEQAISHIFAGRSVLVTVPTGTGKTLMAKAALFAALGRGQRAIYTTPLRALTEEKYRELCADFGDENVGFATGDYKVNREAPIQVEVAEILWNRIVAEKHVSPAETVVMDEGHYFNDPERGYVWEQSIIGLDPRTQLVILSATVGHPEKFCHWVELTRRMPMALVDSRDRKVPLVHEFREEMLIDTVRQLAFSGDVPAIVFVFGREQCFEVARLLKSCRRFTTDEEKARVEKLCDEALLASGVARELRPLLTHGIGIHHAGILPRYKQLVEQLALERLIKFVVSTETIAAGINLPARTVVFPSLRKFIKQQARVITAAEYHQMAGRAGRPQFDDRGLAITLAPEAVVSDLKKELKDAAKRPAYDESKVKRSVYSRHRSDAQRKGDIIWTPELHAELV